MPRSGDWAERRSAEENVKRAVEAFILSTLGPGSSVRGPNTLENPHKKTQVLLDSYREFFGEEPNPREFETFEEKMQDPEVREGYRQAHGGSS